MRSASLTHPALAVVLSRDSGFSAILPQAIALYSVPRFRLFGDSASSHRALFCRAIQAFRRFRLKPSRSILSRDSGFSAIPPQAIAL